MKELTKTMYLFSDNTLSTAGKSLVMGSVCADLYVGSISCDMSYRRRGWTDDKVWYKKWQSNFGRFIRELVVSKTNITETIKKYNIEKWSSLIL